MKTKDVYNKLKKEYNNYLIIIKVGAFYISLEEDAIICNYLFDYQINNNKVGFPLKLINKFTDVLKEKSINYIIYEEDEIREKQEYGENKYFSILKSAKKRIYNEKMEDMLISRIKELIKEDSNNYSMIKNFVDEL